MRNTIVHRGDFGGRPPEDLHALTLVSLYSHDEVAFERSLSIRCRMKILSKMHFRSIQSEEGDAVMSRAFDGRVLPRFGSPKVTISSTISSRNSTTTSLRKERSIIDVVPSRSAKPATKRHAVGCTVVWRDLRSIHVAKFHQVHPSRAQQHTTTTLFHKTHSPYGINTTQRTFT